MTEKEISYFNGFAINEGAYIYKRIPEITAREVRRIFSVIKDNAHECKF